MPILSKVGSKLGGGWPLESNLKPRKKSLFGSPELGEDDGGRKRSAMFGKKLSDQKLLCKTHDLIPRIGGVVAPHSDLKNNQEGGAAEGADEDGILDKAAT